MTNDAGFFDLAAMAAEELDPELQPWIEETDVLGPVLKHPLVFQVPMHLNGIANRQYKHKREALSRAVAAEDWHAYVFLHERPYRFDALFSVIARRVANESIDELAQSVWTDSENIWQNLDGWREVFEITGHGVDPAVTELPRGELTIYRGAQEGVNEEDGFSWTLDRERAEWFARRFKNPEQTPVLVTAKVHRDFVIWHLTGRGEDEIVVDPDNIIFVSSEEI
jgi:hypothetical protein